MIRTTLLLFLCSLPSFAQSHITITDSQGNRATGELSNGQISFRDSTGNTASGTVRDGYVHLNTSQGDVIFGTINNGQVFLTDPSGNTTGTIRDGYISLNNGDGSHTSGTYHRNSDGSVTGTTTTTGGVDPAEEERKRQIQQEQDEQSQAYWEQQRKQNYEAGAQAGQAIGSAINGAIQNHRINAFCKANPTSSYLMSNGVDIDCPGKPLDSFEQKMADDYCHDNPGSWMGFGKHRVDCTTPPDPPTLKWAKWEMEQWQWDFRNRMKLNLAGDNTQVQWGNWRQRYCELAGLAAKYKDLENKKKTCGTP